jgi:hypothetical protein
VVYFIAWRWNPIQIFKRPSQTTGARVWLFNPWLLFVDSHLRSILILSFYVHPGQRSVILSWGLSNKVLGKGKFVLVHAMKVYRGVKVWLHSF